MSSKKSTKQNTSQRSLKEAPLAVQDTASAEQPEPVFPIVGIGASAGGLEALKELLDNTPADTGMAFVVVTHQHPGHTSLLPELLSKETAMPVVEAADGTKLEPNHVYIGAPGGNLAVLSGTLHRMDTDEKESPRFPIDYFFRSLSEELMERAICIVLSGTGTDGTIGLQAIKGESGMSMAQQPQSAKYAGMPSSAIATGLVDYVLPPAAMSQQLIAYAKGSYFARKSLTDKSPVMSDALMQKILVLLRSRTGHDFTAYKSNTLRRRIQRRMNVHQIRSSNEYVRYLQDNPQEIDLLFKELLISVTSFFRDAAAWESLTPQLEQLVETRPEKDMIRAWVPGCATGEEAFSLAILLRECMDKVKRQHEVQIFGTDLDSAAIETARASQYPDGIAMDVAPRRLERFFTHEDSLYRIRKEIREMTIFALHNALKDPPFTRIDILSCRNLLIYLNVNLQRKLIPLFHYALKPGGLLFLGTSETIGNFTDLFETVDDRWKIFRRKENLMSIRNLPDIPAQPLTGDENTFTKPAVATSVAEVHFSKQIERLLLNRFAPPSVIVNERGDILYIHGQTGLYLEPSQGEPRNNIFEMAREGLHIELPVALRECVRKGGEVIRNNIRIIANAQSFFADLIVAKINEPEAIRGLLIVTFRSTPPTPPPPPANHSPRTTSDGEDIEQLQRELQFLKQSHQTAREELGMTNEELKITNEELQSTNEELQSTNEELETSKEEMQSLNEELTTVNAELQSKVEDLSQANDDMQNLLNSTDIATVFLDNELCVKRFTERAKTLFSLRQSDIGRPISDLTSIFQHEELAVSCGDVLRTLSFSEVEVRTKTGLEFIRRIIPYRTADNIIGGLVLTFVDIHQIKDAERAGRSARVYFESIVNTVREPLLLLDGQLCVLSANRAFYRIFRTTPKQTEGKLVYELGSGQWDIPEMRKLLEEILPQDAVFEDYEVEVELPKLGRRSIGLNARRMRQPEGSGDLILLALEDMTTT